MLIEHSFVTTLPAPEALTKTSNFLVAHGFEAVSSGAFAVDQTTWNRLEMQRLPRSRNTANDPSKFPHRVMLEWDRGRVTLAASIEPRVARRSFSFTSSYASSLSRPNKKQGAALAAMMTALVEAIETVLVDNTDPEVAARNWVALELAGREQAKRARRRAIILILAIVIGVPAIITAIAVFASSHH